MGVAVGDADGNGGVLLCAGGARGYDLCPGLLALLKSAPLMMRGESVSNRVRMRKYAMASLPMSLMPRLSPWVGIRRST